MSRTFYRYICLLFLIAATISFMAKVNGYDITSTFLPVDKVAHICIFFMLTALVWKGFRLPIPYALIILGGYGGAIELMQHYYTDRSGDWLDWLADLFGILSFYVVRAIWHSIRPRRDCQH